MSEGKRKRVLDRSESPEPPPPPPRKIKPIAATKLQAFTVGSHRKTPFQKHKEEVEQKKKKESEEAAKVYAEFVASFEDPRDYVRGTKSFVKGGGRTMSPHDEEEHDSDRHHSRPSSRRLSPPPPPPPPPSAPAAPQRQFPAPSSLKTTASKPGYKPMPFVKAGETAKPKTMSMKLQKTMQEDEDGEDDDDALALKEAKAQKKRNLDTFLEEIKREQEDREDRLRTYKGPKSSSSGKMAAIPAETSIALKAAFEDRPGSHDVGDPMTTNLYVGNINPIVTEMMLCQEFAKHGPIASVKIMWPRTNEERERNRNCGFVSFMSREDAEKALKTLDGKTFHDYIMRVGWGKAVPLPPQPVFVLGRETKGANTGLPFNAQFVDQQGGVTGKARAVVTVSKPSNMQQVKIIHRMVERVARHGAAFEALIMAREKGNEKFKFLFDNKCENHIYYRWRLYSILQGDKKSHWRTEPFQMFEGGAWWVPPDVPFDDEGMSNILLDSEDEEKERQRDNIPKGTLGKIAKQRFEIMLRQVTFQRGSIALAMAFAIDHADAADEVIDIIIKSLIITETPVPVKLARLYLVSDILHNSGAHVANAWKYRIGFESRLGAVFEHLNEIYRSIGARLKAEQVRRHISSILNAWETWMVFPQHYIDHLNKVFLKKPTDAYESSEDQNIAEQSIEEEHGSIEGQEGGTHGAPTGGDVDGEPLEEEDIDGESLGENIDGEPLGENIDGELMEEDFGGDLAEGDVDGEPIEEEESTAHGDDKEAVPTHDIQDMFA